MTVKNVTITSKNQITLPAEFVRKLKLGKSHRLQIRLKGTEMVLTPEPSLQEAMQPLWDEFKRTHPNFKPLSDAEFQQATHEAFTARWKQLERDDRI